MRFGDTSVHAIRGSRAKNRPDETFRPWNNGVRGSSDERRGLGSVSPDALLFQQGNWRLNYSARCILRYPSVVSEVPIFERGKCFPRFFSAFPPPLPPPFSARGKLLRALSRKKSIGSNVFGYKFWDFRGVFLVCRLLGNWKRGLRVNSEYWVIFLILYWILKDICILNFVQPLFFILNFKGTYSSRH